MNTLVVYDKEGYALSISGGSPELREPVGVPFLWVDVPEGKRIRVIDGIVVNTSVTPHRVSLEDAPKTETELLKEDNTVLKLAIVELAETQDQSKLETQLALAELAEMITRGDK